MYGPLSILPRNTTKVDLMRSSHGNEVSRVKTRQAAPPGTRISSDSPLYKRESTEPGPYRRLVRTLRSPLVPLGPWKEQSQKLPDRHGGGQKRRMERGERVLKGFLRRE